MKMSLAIFIYTFSNIALQCLSLFFSDVGHDDNRINLYTHFRLPTPRKEVVMSSSPLQPCNRIEENNQNFTQHTVISDVSFRIRRDLGKLSNSVFHPLG